MKKNEIYLVTFEEAETTEALESEVEQLAELSIADLANLKGMTT